MLWDKSYNLFSFVFYNFLNLKINIVQNQDILLYKWWEDFLDNGYFERLNVT